MIRNGAEGKECNLSVAEELILLILYTILSVELQGVKVKFWKHYTNFFDKSDACQQSVNAT